MIRNCLINCVGFLTLTVHGQQDTCQRLSQLIVGVYEAIGLPGLDSALHTFEFKALIVDS
jgi:hypothetical protein